MNEPSLGINRSDIRDIFRLKSVPIVVKLNSVEIRAYILRNSSVLRRFGLSVAPDYTAVQREAREHLKELLTLAKNDGRDAKLRGDKLFIEGRIFRYDGNSIVEIKRNLKPIQNSGPPFSARLPNDPNNIPMRLVSDASDSDTETLVPSTSTPQVVLTAKRPASAIVSPIDLYRPGTRNVAPKESQSPRKKFNERHRGGFHVIYMTINTEVC